MIPTSALNRDSLASKQSNPQESLQSLNESGLEESGLEESGLEESGLDESGLEESGLMESGLSKVGIFLANFNLVRQEPAGDLELFRLRAHRASVWVGLELPHT